MSDPSKSTFKLAAIMLLLTVFMFNLIAKYAIPRDFRATVVKVYGNTGHGSGSVIFSDDHCSQILTNRHVCEGVAYTEKEITKIKNMLKDSFECIFIPDSPKCIKIANDYNNFIKSLNHIGREVNIKFNNLDHSDIKGKVLRMGDNVDLCIVEVQEGNLPVLQVARNEAVPGDKITSIGNPKYMTNAQTQGFVGDEIDYEGRPYQHHTGIIFGGNSGGPVVNERGEIVGVNTLGTPDPTASFMIPLREIKKFLRK